MATQVNDRPAERGINITNILLAMLILLGGVFGTVMTNFMSDINDNVKSMGLSITILSKDNAVTLNELAHIHNTLTTHATRIKALENEK